MRLRAALPAPARPGRRWSGRAPACSHSAGRTGSAGWPRCRPSAASARPSAPRRERYDGTAPRPRLRHSPRRPPRCRDWTAGAPRTRSAPVPGRPTTATRITPPRPVARADGQQPGNRRRPRRRTQVHRPAAAPARAGRRVHARWRLAPPPAGRGRLARSRGPRCRHRPRHSVTSTCARVAAECLSTLVKDSCTTR